MYTVYWRYVGETKWLRYINCNSLFVAHRHQDYLYSLVDSTVDLIEVKCVCKNDEHHLRGD
jgi:hypothetical protein